MICMPVTFTIAPGYEQATLKLLRKLSHYARTEPGILEGKCYRSHTEPRRLFAYLQFTDQVTLDAHRGSGDYGEYVMSNLSGMLKKDGLTIETYEPLFGQETVSR
jgi:quinol monooxygenase YgiN